MATRDGLVGLEEGQSALLALWHIGWRYKFFIAAVTFVCGGIAAALAFTATPVYRAEVAVTEVANASMGSMASLASQLGGLAGLVGLNLGNSTGTSREAQGLLKSRYLVEEFVRRHQGMPELFPNAPKPESLWRTTRKFRNDLLAIRDDKRSGLTVVSISWTDPEIAAKWANEFVALANELLRLHAMREAKASVTYLEKQLDETNVVELRRVLYNLIENETKTLMLANVKAEYAFRVVDPAVAPEERFSPKRRLMVLLGLVIGGILGSLAAFAHNAWTRYRVTTPAT